MATPAPSLSGTVHGGLTAVSGARVTLYAAGSIGYGSGATELASTASDSSGSFSFTSWICPADNPETYVIVESGNPGGGTNPAIGMMSLTGPCDALTASAFATVNELTTVAAEWALAQFSDSTGAFIGTSSTNATGLTTPSTCRRQTWCRAT